MDTNQQTFFIETNQPLPIADLFSVPARKINSDKFRHNDTYMKNNTPPHRDLPYTILEINRQQALRSLGAGSDPLTPVPTSHQRERSEDRRPLSDRQLQIP
ncbi:hypothetical protein NPIL_307201 [Nephila pilipes]|uniref:Uncharacterized protein n=1 Tax=Nephila pilipes TaxID=299642 RepID=A0A8X6NY77_NEPPI|nr:hypothetical protein NPIL_307201 [Nephila pilipes]